jgi:hypothetical protein
MLGRIIVAPTQSHVEILDGPFRRHTLGNSEHFTPSVSEATVSDPWQSKLWDHLEEIRSLRRARATWKDIAAHLGEKHGVQITAAAVRNFFVRSRNPNLRLPDGLEHLRPAPPEHPSGATPASAVHHAKKETIDPLSTEVPDEPTELFTKWKKQQNS